MSEEINFSLWDKEKIRTFRNGIEKLAEQVKIMMELFNLDLKSILAFVLLEAEH